MVRSTAIEVLARRLGLNVGRVAALAQRAAESGALPKARGRDVPDLGPLDLARLLLCAVADRGLGSVPQSVRAYSSLAANNGAILVDVVEGWIRGTVPISGVGHLVVQIEPEPAATIMSHGGAHFDFGPERSRGAAARTVIVPGESLSAICHEFRGVTPDSADEMTAVGRLAAALN
ncbi:MAG: hypothetical protein J0I08_12130 [Rhizobiales bacterium]|nr:hypothetical protein [Hyphomicrobiales bacterium]